MKLSKSSCSISLETFVLCVEISSSDGGIFGAAKIQIRGASTMGNNNQPIYVVDGVILDNNVSGNDDLNWGSNSSDYGNELKNLNPDDFETVSSASKDVFDATAKCCTAPIAAFPILKT